MTLHSHSGVLTDTEIEKRCQDEFGMIHPFVPYSEKEKQINKITWGLASCGCCCTSPKRVRGSGDSEGCSQTTSH